MIIYKYPLLLLIALIILNSCSNSETNSQLTIAITKASPIENYSYYIKWLKSADSTIKYIDLDPLSIDSALKVLDNCSGVLFTGGTDVYPGIYGNVADTARCWEADRHLDSLEIAVAKKAFENKIPVVGVCRGLQVINVALGGILHIDLPVDFDSTVIHRTPEGKATKHGITVIEDTQLSNISGISTGIVNSSHHQGIKILAPGLIPAAYSDDGLIESIEWKEKEGKGFLLAVQWHPERLDYDNPFSGNILRRFIKEVKTRNKQLIDSY